mmetsp:Transcript_28572/g.43186  ORF Transcript_28572/g.43186 Transcript_28572/m.43186 type:complete len:124 (+) Transcript_28572:2473-2844(+)
MEFIVAKRKFNLRGKENACLLGVKISKTRIPLTSHKVNKTQIKTNPAKTKKSTIAKNVKMTENGVGAAKLCPLSLLAIDLVLYRTVNEKIEKRLLICSVFVDSFETGVATGLLLHLLETCSQE